MVDAALTSGPVRKEARAADIAEAATWRVTVSAATPDALARYGALADAGAVFGPAQSPAWVDAWVQCVNPDAVLVLAEAGGMAVLGLALEVVRKGPFRVARLMGRSHANGNFPAMLPGFAPDIGRVVSAIRAARPDIDMLALDRLLADKDGLRNPLLDLPHSASPNVSLAVDLHGGFAGLLAGPSGKRRRKKYRSSSRKIEAAGGYRRIEASTPEEVERLLGTFLAMKAVRFRRAGIANVFGDAPVQDFFRALFGAALRHDPKPFALHGLEVGGKLRAITGSSRFGDRLICEFGAIIEDELAHASPGDFLFYENIREACDNGLAVYDFSVGDELYKRLWCDIETAHADVTLPLTARGRLLGAAARLRAHLVAAVKRNPVLWRLAKAMRRGAAGSGAKPAAAAAEDRDD